MRVSLKNLKTVAVIQARMGSTRLKGKVLKPLGDTRVINRVFDAVLRVRNIDAVCVATSELEQDNELADHCYRNGWNVFRGSETDVLSRFVEAIEKSGADIILRLTADCPYLDPSVIEQVIRLRQMTGTDYCSNIDPPTFPDGLDVECFTRRALEEAHQEATRPSDRDCVTRYISRNRSRYKAANLTCPLPGLEKERWVLDTQDDYEFCCEIAKRVTSWPPSYIDILGILDKHPELRKINKDHVRNERFYEGISTEDLGTRTYGRSQVLLKRAERHIPLGAQTFSKSKLQFPDGSPLFLTHGDGAYVYDVDGNDYVDLVSALLPNILGYRDPDVDWAVRNQLDRGASLSLATELEADLAERLHQHIPCAEMVRFGKTGSDVTTAAVRLARHVTGRDRILSAGYHGWSSEFVGPDPMRGNGVPRQVSELTDIAEYGSTSMLGLLRISQRYAAVIVEPETNHNFLQNLRTVCNETGTILIFDEIITAFRWEGGSAQKKFGIIPDLATMGKAMANGLPISAIVGKKEIMRKMAPPDGIFFSGTYMGECLSLAAAIATLDKIQRENVTSTIIRNGDFLREEIRRLIKFFNLEQDISVDDTPILRLKFSDEKKPKLFMRLMAANGVLIIGSNNLSLSHKSPQFTRILSAYKASLESIAS